MEKMLDWMITTMIGGGGLFAGAWAEKWRVLGFRPGGINVGVLTPPAAAKAPLSKVLDLQMHIWGPAMSQRLI